MKEKPVIIVGAGLTGLSCAKHLHSRDIPYLLIEANSSIGGRVQTRLDDHQQVRDIGFQVLLSSYPELRHVLNLQDLNLRKFNSGALIAMKDQQGIHKYLLSNPLQHPEEIFSGLFSSIIPLADKALVLGLIAKSHMMAKPSHQGKTTIEFLQEYGFSQSIIELFWRPFLSGVFLDPNLQLPADYFLFLVKCFSSGSVTVPEKGMGEIPKQIAKSLDPDRIKLNSRISKLEDKAVHLSSGEKIEASFVVATSDLQTHDTDFLSVTNYYFHTRQPSSTGKWLVLLPRSQNFKINNVISMSSVASSYGLDDRTVLSACVLGTESTTEEILQELKQVFPEYTDLTFDERHVVKKALPKKFKNVGFEFRDGIFWCGDQYSSPSINGALRSGRLTAEEIAKLWK